EHEYAVMRIALSRGKSAVDGLICQCFRQAWHEIGRQQRKVARHNQNRVKHGGKTRNSSGDAGQWTLYAVAGLVLEDRQAKRLILLDVLIGTNGHVVRVRPQGLHDMGDHGPAAEGKQAFISIAHATPLAASQNERPNMTWAGAPALGGLLVALFGLHPDFRAIGEALLLPERRLGLEVIHDEDVSLVGILPMRTGRLHNDDIFTNV